MTAPRMILPGVYEICIRTSEQRFFLKASRAVNDAIRYLLAYYAEKHAVRLLCFVVMSNHIHILVEDPECNTPNFMRDFASVSARLLNRLHARNESLWSRKGYSLIRLLRPEDFLDRVRYFFANPRRAGVSRRMESFKGAWSAPSLLTSSVGVERPKILLRHKGPLPPDVRLSLKKPSWFDRLDNVQYQKLLEHQLTLANQSSVRRRAECARDRRVCGHDARPDRPRIAEPTLTITRESTPAVLCGDPNARQVFEDLLRHFRQMYQRARTAWKRENTADVRFPVGTWQMQRVFGCVVDERDAAFEGMRAALEHVVPVSRNTDEIHILAMG